MYRTLAISVIILMALTGMIVYFRWSSAIRQPLNFSHAEHVRRSISCEQCHNTSELDSLPQPALCQSCHKNMTNPQTVQWVRAYRVAPDIIFSHKDHLKDSCATCHEALVSGKRWIHESHFTMDFCMKCHEERRADNSCKACHKNR